MTNEDRKYFTRSLMPRLRRIANRRYRKNRDGEDQIADFIATAWLVFCEMIEHVDQPSIEHLLGTLHHRMKRKLSPSIQMLSLSDSNVRHQAEAISA